MSRNRLLILLALTAGPPIVESAVLRSVGFVSALPLAPQASAPAPFGVFHDLRWLFVYHASWWAFAAELIGLVVIRSLLNAAIVFTVWPAEAPRPTMRRLVEINLVFVAVTVAALSLWAAVAVAASGTSLSWFVVGEVLPIFWLALVLQRGSIVGDWWRGFPPLSAIGWSVLTFFVLTAAGAAVGFTPGGWVVPVAGVAGAINAWLWYRLVRATVLGRTRLTWAPVAPVAMLVAAAGLLAMGLFAGVGSDMARRPPPPLTGPGADRVPHAVVYVAGYDSTFDGRRETRGVPMVQFSYRGLDSHGDPLPYGAAVTHQSLETSARLLAEQVAVVHRRANRPVALVSQSEGTLVTRTYLDRLPHPEVEAAVQLSPLAEPARAYYPPPTAGSGWGVGTGWELRGMITIVRWIGRSDISADEPFVRSIIDHATLYRNRMLCPVSGVRMIAFLPTAAAAVTPPGKNIDIPAVEAPGLHASLFGRPDIQRVIIRFLSGERVGSQRGAYYPIVRNAAAAWQAPALALHLNPVWHAEGQPDAAFDQDGCSARPPYGF